MYTKTISFTTESAGKTDEVLGSFCFRTISIDRARAKRRNEGYYGSELDQLKAMEGAMAPAWMDKALAEAIEELEKKMAEAAKELGADAVTSVCRNIIPCANDYTCCHVILYGKAVKHRYGRIPA